jgi:iron-sulfur cluster assembly protein
MIEVTNQAVEKLVEYLQENNISSALRVALLQNGCAGSSLGLALDEKKDSDIVTDYDGLTFLIDASLSDDCGTVKVDYLENDTHSGFSISSEKPVQGVGSGCNPNTCGSGGGCSC